MDAILRSASRIRDYMERLRALTAAGGRRRRADGRRRSCPRWRRAGRPPGAACAPPEGCAFLWTAPPPAPVPCSGRSWTGRCSTCWTTPPASPRRGRGAPVGVCGGGRTHRGRGGLRPRLLPEALARAGRGFYTGDASRPREGHMGMGLTFARQTARRHGGTLELSNTGRGRPGGPHPAPLKKAARKTAPPSCIFPRSALS
ncbi:MAG: hypothetical protein ACLRNQ_19675 [Flavonifractor plautii]